MLLDRQGPGGVKIVTTSSTGKTGATGRSLICRRPSWPESDAAFPSRAAEPGPQAHVAVKISPFANSKMSSQLKS
jgi:hypothetical protein